MGRNYYGIDPETVPNRASWTIGCKMADSMIERYVEEKGAYPEEVGFIIWATDVMKTGGDDVAYVLWLMGVRPVWSRTGGQIIDLEVVPLEELKRPRIDVTVRITGLFRDTFPNIIDMFDDAVGLVSSLDEKDEENYLAANLRKDILEKIENGMPADEARRSASVRVFGCPPGMYGPGVNQAIESGNWKTVEDLADIYVTWGSYGYARGMHGKPMREDFVKRFGKVGVTVKNMPDREIDLLDIDDVYGYLGGLNAFVRAYGKKDAISVIGDGSDPENTKIRDANEELRFVFRSKIFNPKFLNGLKEHGYRGVSEIANMTEYLLGWDATSDAADDWMYSGILEKFLEDDDTREWMKDENPFAMMNILERLSEAIERGLWDATDDEKNRLADLFMETEERIEEVTDR
jgi:cobaltochelatase CobN